MLKLCIPIGAMIIGTCNPHVNTETSGGTLEANEVTVSAEASGRLLAFPVEEGNYLLKDSIVGLVDTIQLYRQLAGTIAKLRATENKVKSWTAEQQILIAQLQEQEDQVKVLQAELDGLLVDQQRYENLSQADAIPSKQLDDVNVKVAVASARLIAARSSMLVTRKRMEANVTYTDLENSSIKEECEKIRQELKAMEENMERCRIVNPVTGRVLYKYVNASESVIQGTKLYTIADLHKLFLRCYLSPEQRGKVKLGQEVTVYVEHDHEGRTYKAKVEWLSEVAEFTPKQVQTSDERAVQVYAVKIGISNADEHLKIGMYGNVAF